MSSKGVAARGNKEALFQILTLIETGHFSNISLRKLQYLKRYLYILPSDERYTLATKGKKALTENKIWALTIPAPKTWDGKWRFVLFDIPVDKRKRRDSFRLRLKELGLTLYQNSVWVYPYPLEKPVRDIADFYKLGKCVSFITADHISGEATLLKRYHL